MVINNNAYKNRKSVTQIYLVANIWLLKIAQLLAANDRLLDLHKHCFLTADNSISSLQGYLCIWVCFCIGLYMSHVVRKPVLMVSDQVQHKPDCTVTEDG